MIQGDLFQGMGYVIAAIVASVPAWLATRRTRRHFEREFQPNGGSSTKDQLNRIETWQAVAAAEAAAAKEALHSVAVQVARVDVRLDEHVQYHLEHK